LVNVRNAVLSNTIVSPVELPLLSSDVKTGKVRHITVRNTGDYPLHYEVLHRPALAVQSWDSKTGELLAAPKYQDAPATVDIDTKRFTLEPGHKQSLVLFFHEPTSLNAAENWLYGGYITVQPKLTYADMLSGNFKKQSAINVYYSGLRGDYKSVSVLTRPESGLPALFNGASGAVVDAKAKSADNVFSVQKGDIPIAVARLLFPCKHLVVKAIDANGKDAGVINGGDNKLLGRNDNTDTNSSLQLPWDGTVLPQGATSTTPAVNAPDGVYHLQLLALRPFGKEDVPSDWQVWNSPTFTIDRSATAKPPAQGLDDSVNKYIKSRVHSIGRNVEDADKLADSVLPRPFRIVSFKQ